MRVIRYFNFVVVVVVIQLFDDQIHYNSIEKE